MKLEDFLRQTATDLVHLLKNPPSSIVPGLQAGDPTYNALRDIAAIFNQSKALPDLHQTPLPIKATQVAASPTTNKQDTTT